MSQFVVLVERTEKTNPETEEVTVRTRKAALIPADILYVKERDGESCFLKYHNRRLVIMGDLETVLTTIEEAAK